MSQALFNLRENIRKFKSLMENLATVLKEQQKLLKE